MMVAVLSQILSLIFSGDKPGQIGQKQIEQGYLQTGC